MPEAALADNPDRPQLRFIEKNCVQCGLCASTCPEHAITLEPRLLLADGGKARKQPRVLNEAEPFRCIRCGKPFGTLQAIEAMIAQARRPRDVPGRGADRLKMCGDCRVIDLHSRSRRSADHRPLSHDCPHPVASATRRAEELARAEVYGLLAQLFYAPPVGGAATSSSAWP